MQEILTKIAGYLTGVWRFRWFALGLAWAIAIAGWIWVGQLPEKYESRARIHIDTNSLLRPLLRGLAIQPDIGQRVALVSRTLLSRPNMEKLMRMADLDLAINTDAEKEKVLQQLKDGVRFDADRRNSSLYSVAPPFTGAAFSLLSSASCWPMPRPSSGMVIFFAPDRYGVFISGSR